ncbi:hypothetical protein PFISCL1PPCAC_29006, partial [Pristionchus fissidentatus]
SAQCGRHLARMNEDKLIAEAIASAVRGPAKIPPEYIQRLTHEKPVVEAEVAKITLQNGLVTELDEDSEYLAFLKIGDVMCSVNDKVACRPDFNLQEQLKGCKTFACKYIRLRNCLDEEAKVDDVDQRDSFQCRSAVLYNFNHLRFGLSFLCYNGRVMVDGVIPRSIGAIAAMVGDAMLHVNGKRMRDPHKTFDELSTELKCNGFVKIVLQRPTNLFIAFL